MISGKKAPKSEEILFSLLWFCDLCSVMGFIQFYITVIKRVPFNFSASEMSK